MPLKARGTGPYFYLPKLENHLEARLGRCLAAFGRQTPHCAAVDQSHGPDRDDLAAFEMDEILYELRDYIVGLNCGRWDYIFSFIKKFSRRPDFVCPIASRSR